MLGRLLLLLDLLLLHLLLHELGLSLGQAIDLSLSLRLLLSEVDDLLRRDRLGLRLAWIWSALLCLHHMGWDAELLLPHRFQAVHGLIAC